MMNIDGTGVRRVSNGEGRTTCGYFYDGGRRILYSSTFRMPPCPPPADRSQGLCLAARQPRDLHGAKPTAPISGAHAERRLQRRGHVSPDGKRIVFTSTRTGTSSSTR